MVKIYSKNHKKSFYGLIYLFLAFFAFSCSVAPSVRKSDSQMRTMANGVPPELKSEPIVLLQDSMVVVPYLNKSGKNKLTTHNYRVYLVQKDEFKILETLVIYHSETVESRPSIKARIYYPNGSKKIMGWEKFSSQRVQEAGYYESNRWANFAKVPDYAPGVIIALEITRRYSKPEFENLYVARENYPILKKDIVLEIPENSNLVYGFANKEGLKADSSKWQIKEKKKVAYHFRNLAKIENFSHIKYPENWFGAVYYNVPPEGNVSYSWEQIGDHYLSFLPDISEPSEKIREFSKQVEGSRPEEIIKSAYNLLKKKIRYHADEKEIFAIVPRQLDIILNNGYGDCKEMSFLMMAVLKEKGLDAGLALTSSPGVWQLHKSYPALSYFNHVILYYKKSDGKLVFVDPTVKFGDFNNSHFPLNQQKAFFLKKNASFVDYIFSGDEFENRIVTTSEIKKESSGWIQTGVLEFHGLSAFNLFRSLSGLTPSEEGEFLKEFLQESFNLESTNSVLDTLSPGSARINYTANINRSELKLGKGGMLINGPSLYGGLNRFTTLDFEGPRYFEEIVQEDSWSLPEGFRDLESNNLEFEFCKGVWSSSPGKVSRKFRGERKNFSEAESKTLSSYYKARQKFLKTTIWR